MRVAKNRIIIAIMLPLKEFYVTIIEPDPPFVAIGVYKTRKHNKSVEIC